MSDPEANRSSFQRSLALGHVTGMSGELKDMLLSAFQAPDYKPPILPAAALELTTLSRDPSVSYQEVARVLERDPLLVASVLKTVQSPVYAGRARVQSLRDALSRLGITHLRDIVWQVLIGTRVFRAPDYAGMLERLQSHSIFVAHAARIIAKEAGVEAEYAFLGGLLHDVGWSGALVAATANPPPSDRADALYLAIDKVHCDAGVIMAKLWELPSEIVDVTGHHHDAARLTQPGLVPVICVAEQLAEDFGFGVEASEAADDTAPLGLDENLVGRYEHAVEVLGLAEKLAPVRRQIEEVASRLRADAA